MVVGDKGSIALFQGKEPLMRSTIVFFTGISSEFKISELNILGGWFFASVRAVSLVLIEEQPTKVIIITTIINRIVLS